MKRIVVLTVATIFAMTTAVFATDEVVTEESNDNLVEQSIEHAKKKENNNGHYTIHIDTNMGRVNINDNKEDYAWWNGNGVSYNFDGIKNYIRRALKLASDAVISLSDPDVMGVPGNGGNTTSIFFDANITNITNPTNPTDSNEEPEDSNIKDPDDPVIDILDEDSIDDPTVDPVIENIDKNEGDELDEPITKKVTDEQPQTGDEAGLFIFIILMIGSAITGLKFAFGKKEE